MKSIKEDWQALINGVRDVSGQVEKSLEGLAKLEKAQAAGVGEAAGTDPVLEIILGEERGVGVTELTQRTGLSEKEIKKAVYHLRREGRIKRVFVANR